MATTQADREKHWRIHAKKNERRAKGKRIRKHNQQIRARQK